MDLAAPNSGRVCADQLAHALTTPTNSSQCLIDLRRATFVDPAGLVAIAVVADRAVHDGRTVEVRAPTSAGCANYLSRMDLAQHLADLGVAHNLPLLNSRTENPHLRELQHFTSEEDLETVAATIVRVYAEGDQAVAQPLYHALFELGVNAVQHSGQGGGYVALQAFRNLRDVAFAVGDSGQGLLGSLAPTEGLRTDAAAIRAAARKHLSATHGAGRGRGITEVIDLTGRHNGSFSILTGSAYGQFRRGGSDPRVTETAEKFLGTLAQARFDF